MRAMAEDQQPSHPVHLPLALVRSLEILEQGKYVVDKPSLGLSVGRQWEPGKGVGHRLRLEAWKGGAHLSQLGPAASS